MSVELQTQTLPMRHGDSLQLVSLKEVWPMFRESGRLLNDDVTLLTIRL
jgi:hypothetical protein